SSNCAAFDVSLGCSGFVYGLWLAHSLISSKACSKVLLCAGDTPSIHSDLRNRLVNPLFGDAGSATILEWRENTPTAYFDVGTDGSGWSNIAIPASGARIRINHQILDEIIKDNEGNPWRLCDSLISGLPVFSFSVTKAPESINKVLNLAKISILDLDFIALHQANKQIIDEIGLRLGLKKGSLHSQTFSRYGNQSTASVAGVLCDALDDKMAEKSLQILLCGFGVGFSWATALLHFDKCYNGGIIFYQKPLDLPTEEEQISFWKSKFCCGDSNE
ncbi:MAG: hypothetical protein IJS50_03760, partial [Desulfovibrio sp.]|nr:hypothetical protein [Desulfovibrio sp.]